MHAFLSNLANRQTDKQTRAKTCRPTSSISNMRSCVLNISPSIELCCLVVFDLSCNGLFCFFFFVLFVFLLLLSLMANKVVCDPHMHAMSWQIKSLNRPVASPFRRGS